MRQLLYNCVIVGTGGFAGSVTRYLLAFALQRYSMVFPVGTLAANLAGCFIVGALIQLAEPTPALSPETKLLLITGFCGGFTTMSSMIYETSQFLKDGEYLHAGGYIVISFVGSLTLFFLGALAMKMALRTTGGILN